MNKYICIFFILLFIFPLSSETYYECTERCNKNYNACINSCAEHPHIVCNPNPLTHEMECVDACPGECQWGYIICMSDCALLPLDEPWETESPLIKDLNIELRGDHYFLIFKTISPAIAHIYVSTLESITIEEYSLELKNTYHEFQLEKVEPNFKYLFKLDLQFDKATLRYMKIMLIPPHSSPLNPQEENNEEDQESNINKIFLLLIIVIALYLFYKKGVEYAKNKFKKSKSNTRSKQKQ